MEIDPYFDTYLLKPLDPNYYKNYLVSACLSVCLWFNHAKKTTYFYEIFQRISYLYILVLHIHFLFSIYYFHLKIAALLVTSLNVKQVHCINSHRYYFLLQLGAYFQNNILGAVTAVVVLAWEWWRTRPQAKCGQGLRMERTGGTPQSIIIAVVTKIKCSFYIKHNALNKKIIYILI